MQKVVGSSPIIRTSTWPSHRVAMRLTPFSPRGSARFSSRGGTGAMAPLRGSFGATRWREWALRSVSVPVTRTRSGWRASRQRESTPLCCSPSKTPSQPPPKASSCEQVPHCVANTCSLSRDMRRAYKARGSLARVALPPIQCQYGRKAAGAGERNAKSRFPSGPGYTDRSPGRPRLPSGRFGQAAKAAALKSVLGLRQVCAALSSFGSARGRARASGCTFWASYFARDLSSP